ncbi:uncharacterized protein V6R79_020769 [Siganus canaliculatus]
MIAEITGAIAGVSTNEKIFTCSDYRMTCSNNPDDAQLGSKPPSYIVLISEVILSSPSQKLNLASIYSAMEERFPFLRSRSPGWRNSVRHSLSVCDCFVKVSRCEAGRGHYWGVHSTHLRDIQQGDFRQCRKSRGRKEKSHCVGRLDGKRSVGYLDLLSPLQETRKSQLSPLELTQPCYQPGSIKMDWESPIWVKPSWFPGRVLDSNGWALVGMCGGQPLISRLHCWKTSDLQLTGMRESYDSGFMTPVVPPLRFLDGWWSY